VIKRGEYDQYIQETCKEALPSIDWRIIKAQFWQESRFDPRATSPAGARGIAQIMPGTWDRFGKGDPYNAHSSITAGIDCMANLIGQWSRPRPDIDRICLALASYNAGLGHILKAQKLSGDKPLYAEIIEYLPNVTGDHSKETIDYVSKILGFWCAEVLL
jgi:membrane-bound lytic murein transglycosylase MltF